MVNKSNEIIIGIPEAEAHCANPECEEVFYPGLGEGIEGETDISGVCNRYCSEECHTQVEYPNEQGEDIEVVIPENEQWLAEKWFGAAARGEFLPEF